MVTAGYSLAFLMTENLWRVSLEETQIFEATNFFIFIYCGNACYTIQYGRDCLSIREAQIGYLFESINTSKHVNTSVESVTGQHCLS